MTTNYYTNEQKEEIKPSVVEILKIITEDENNRAKLTDSEKSALNTIISSSDNNSIEELIGEHMINILIKYLRGAFDIDEYFEDTLDDNI